MGLRIGVTGHRPNKRDTQHQGWPNVVNVYKTCRSIRKTANLTGYSKTGVEYILKTTGTKMFSRARSGDENASRKSMSETSRAVRDSILMENYIPIKSFLPQRLVLC